jgi:hypothetical protein
MSPGPRSSVDLCGWKWPGDQSVPSLGQEDLCFRTAFSATKQVQLGVTEVDRAIVATQGVMVLRVFWKMSHLGEVMYSQINVETRYQGAGMELLSLWCPSLRFTTPPTQVSFIDC